jgi:amino acid adenylation domain-containing protein/FkbM family methyltransferase
MQIREDIGNKSEAAAHVATAEHRETFPASKAQKQLWLLAQLESEASVAYNVCYAIEFQGPLQLDILKESLRRVVDRHESLRSRLDPGGETLTVLTSPLLEVPEEDISHLPASEQDKCLAKEAGQEFQFLDDTLFRGRLFRTGERRHILLLISHHVIMDGASMHLVLREMGEIYSALCRRKDCALPPAEQYRAYLQQQDQHATSADWRASRDYWLQQFKDPAAPLNLRTDYPRPITKTFRGGLQSAIFEDALVERLARFSNVQGCTLFSLLYSACAVVLHRLSGQEEFVIGINSSGRTNRATRSVAGYLTRVLPIRNAVASDVRLAEILQRTTEHVLMALEHQDYSLTELVDEIKTVRMPGRSPVVDITFNFDNFGGRRGGSFSFEGVESQLIPVPVTCAKFDMDINLVETRQGLRAEVEYNRDLFLPDTVRRFLEMWRHALEQVIEDPDVRVGEIELLGEEERREVVEAWSGREAGKQEGPDRREGLVEIVEGQAREHPQGIAAAYEGVQMNYGELNRRANRLAHLLKERKVGRETRVGVCLERSLELLVAVIGIWKAGGVYIPLDAAYPRERLGFMLDDAGVEVLLTEAGMAEELPAGPGQVVCLDLEWAELERQSEENPEVRVEDRDLAYVMYTSGSTGKPKGVMIEHRGMMNHLWAKVEELGLGEKDVVVQNAPASFDISVWQMMAPLLTGGQVQIIGEEIARDGFRLLREVHRLGATVLETVPTLLGMMIQQQLQAGSQRLSLGELRWMISNAEALPISMCHQWIKLYPRIPLLNAYGPTECSDDIAHYVAEPSLGSNWTCAPLGKPLKNLRAYVLDPAMRPVPPGVLGELYIGGVGVGRGYLNRPNLTAEKFVPDPFTGASGGRLYRTGDQVRWAADGNLEFIGRLDDQVKLRGMRLELKEIESVLNDHESVLRAAVIVREDQPGDKRLVGYVIAKTQGNADPGELRNYLKQRLPDFMVPSAIVLLDRMPLTVNEKIDRRALPSPENIVYETGHPSAAPRTWVEEVVTGIWSEVLRIPRVGIHDDFFDLGGHSLLATQVISRIRTVLQVELPLRKLFEQPTISGLAETIHQQMQNRTETAGRQIKPVTGKDRLHASYAQQRLWFSHQFEQDKGLYNMPAVLRLEGKLEIPALEQGIDEIVRRHEVLRTAFDEINGDPIQVIHDARHVELPVIDLETWASESRNAEIKRLINEQVQIPFDLGSSPMLRTLLLRVNPETHLLLLNIHHIAGDEWSLGVFMRELVALYEAFRQGQESPLAEPTIQYADYGVWQRAWSLGEGLRDQLAYWKQQLAGAPETLQLPMVGPRPAVPSHRGGQFAFQLSGELQQQLQDLGRREGTTLFMTLLAAFQTLLYRYSGQTDIVVGCPIASRTSDETEDLMGFFINIIVLRTDFSGTPAFEQLLRRVKDVALGAYANQDLPFDKLVEELRPTRDPGRTPLFQVLFDLQNDSKKKWEVTGLSLSQMEPEFPSEEFDLALAVTERQDRLDGVVRYRAELFDRETIRRLAGHFECLLKEIVNSPQQSVADLSLLAPEEKAQFLRWNRTERPYATDKCLHQLFEDQAKRTPDAVAVVCDGHELRYGELNRRANQLANYLRERGVGPEKRAGICLGRGWNMVVAILGVLKAGSAYVPLDPEYPQNRLEFMLNDGGVHLLLTDNKFSDRVPQNSTRILLDTDWERIATHSEVAPDSGVEPGDAAYAIYTSGSTGRPKGTIIEHRSVVNFLNWAREAFRADELAGVLFSTSICFDISVFELFAPLAWGGTLIVSENALQIPQLKDRARASLINTVPSAAAELVKMKALPSGVHTVNLAGEAAKRPLVDELYKLPSVERVLNAYGPTETTIYSTFALLSHGGGEVTIGKPIANTQAFVLDANLQLVPVGVFGELYLGGRGVARGYIDRPEITANVFLPNPFSREPGGRMYATGDRVRWTAAGELEFAGRLDHQIKIRGFRIEPGEIESVIVRQKGVKEAVVIPDPGAVDEKRLVAYVAPTLPGTFLEELKTALRQSLPEHMIPSAFVLLEKMPRTANGKLDRKALPSPDAAAFVSAMKYVPPHTDLERTLCRIWAGILRLERIGIEDNFFESGGHSLIATRVTSQLRSELGVEVPVRAIFEHPTVAQFAHHVQKRMEDEPAKTLAIGARTTHEDAPLSYEQRRLWFIHQLQPGGVAYNSPLNLRLMGELDKEILEKCLTEIVRRHEVLRTTFPSREGSPIQVIHPARPVTMSLVNLEELSEPEKSAAADRLRSQEAAEPFDLAHGPLFKAKLVKLGAQEHELLLNMHHIASDGWSREILLHELLSLWGAYKEGRASQLPELPIQYADYAIWQQKWLHAEVFEKQARYWRKQLQDLPVLELPTDRPRPALTVHPAAELRFSLSKTQSESLVEWARLQGATPFMVLLAAFQWLMHGYSGQEDVAVGSVIANRNRKEIEGVIGFFVNTLVLRTDVSGQPTFQELTKRVQEMTLDAYAHHDLPFEKLVEELNPDRDLGHSPLFQVRFALENASWVSLESAGLQVEEIDTPLPEVKFDLTMVAETTHDGIIKGCLVYAADLFERATMQRLVAQYERLLHRAVSEPDLPLARLSLMEETERAQVVLDWNATAQSFRHAGCLHELFEEQAGRDPQATAVVYEDARLSYSELNERANQLANYLREMGVGPEVRVGLCLERGLDLVVAILAILKAGGAYVPLDPSHPADRIGLLLEDAGIPVLLTTERLRGQLPSQWIQTVCLDTDWSSIAQCGRENLPGTAHPDNLAYVIYTSGSSGKPKAVGIEHRHIVNYVLAISAKTHWAPGWRSAFVSAIAADLGNTVLLTSLSRGGELHVLSDECARDARRCSRYFSQHRIDCVKITPSHMASLDMLTPAGDLLPRRLLVLGGEASQWRWIDELKSRRQDCRIMNHYGPTECTVGAVACVLNDTPRSGSANVPLGVPLGNVQVYVLDEWMDPLPPGMAGELFIGGKGVGRGYLNREILTAEKFVPDPFSKTPGSRLYKTGDKARWRSDGLLEFLGRMDQQVKIRGFRVELEEIEAVLKEHPEVRQSAVVLRHESGGPQLIGYVSLHRQAAAAPAGESLYTLPNGISIRHQNRVETEYLYREIFESKAYLQCGIELPQDACVFDVGANIGMFSLFAAEQCPAGRVFAFEPIESLYRKLEFNTSLVSTRVRTFHMGMAQADMQAEFTFYPRYSMMSGIAAYADMEVEVGVIRRTLENRLEHGDDQAGVLLQQGSEFLRERFLVQPEVCRLRRLSDVMREEGVQFIDLLKIDVQRAELDVLNGIGDSDWDAIAQIVMEVHDGWTARTEGRLAKIVALLESHGFEVTANQYDELKGTDRWNIYSRNPAALARRPSPATAAGVELLSGNRTVPGRPVVSSNEIKEYLKQRLPEYMVPSVIAILPQLPLTSNGKLDKRALPVPGENSEPLSDFVPPRTKLEQQLCAIWEEVLHVKKIGIHSNFFEVGGHSLLATQVVSRIQNLLDVEISLVAIFRSPTVAGLAIEIERVEQEAEHDGSARIVRVDRAAHASAASSGSTFPQANQPPS